MVLGKASSRVQKLSSDVGGLRGYCLRLQKKLHFSSDHHKRRAWRRTTSTGNAPCDEQENFLKVFFSLKEGHTLFGKSALFRMNLLNQRSFSKKKNLKEGFILSAAVDIFLSSKTASCVSFPLLSSIYEYITEIWIFLCKPDMASIPIFLTEYSKLANIFSSYQDIFSKKIFNETLCGIFTLHSKILKS